MNTHGRRVDVAVVGATISGVLIALALRKRGASVVVLDHFLDNAALESLLEIPPSPLNSTSLAGTAFAEAGREAMASVGVVAGETAVRIRLPAAGHILVGNSDGQDLQADWVVYSPFGVEAGLPWVPNLGSLIGRGVSKDAWSDAAFFRGQPVGVVGGDRRAGEQALIAVKAGARPTIFCPQTHFADHGLRQRLVEFAIPVAEGKNIADLVVDDAGNLKEAVVVDDTGGVLPVSLRALFLAQGLVCDWSIFEGSQGHEPMHPRLLKAGVAGRTAYWDYEAQVQEAIRIEREIGG